MVAIDGFVTRCGDDADLFDPALERFLGDDLEHGLGEPVAVDERQHGFLHGVGRGILPRTSAGRRDHRLRNLHGSIPSCSDRGAFTGTGCRSLTFRGGKRRSRIRRPSRSMSVPGERVRLTGRDIAMQPLIGGARSTNRSGAAKPRAWSLSVGEV